MITEAILNLFFNLVALLLDLIPSVAVDFLGEMSSSIIVLVNFIKSANTFIPVDTALTVITLMFTIKNFKIITFIVNWIIRRIGDVIP